MIYGRYDIYKLWSIEVVFRSYGVSGYGVFYGNYYVFNLL